MTDEPCALKEFWEELENTPRRTKLYYAARRKVVAVLCSPQTLRRKAVHVSQRARRGWSDEDTWGFDYYLSGVIAGGVEKLRSGHGYGNAVEDEAEWDRDLRDIVEGFKLRQSAVRDSGAPTPEDKAKMERAFDLLRKHYDDLWD